MPPKGVSRLYSLRWMRPSSVAERKTCAPNLKV
ncbi:hypothetical protein I307_01577 [Cryptococcus deuterogattii 99/473]|uniref:Uncharacterized protein n=1 Tax=Cryptococcus deuterogattii Ram5 TaxID=1296110 RepID=A0A0D0SZY8_9TREE|nr:hypothetical protein I309_04103 [Cryptococcus deuterogattii LA55]KIR36468.1 hypothetical protein I352_01417 [Cryptococcus deuterogattii MMRL2647]KIR38872.1 hypothetical protein I313_05012 [Cryptococcus deuterogattii Ram5]KIR75899.1 hypothetical protein I310_00597 [Cryptococcus deuterogattii CA1014]KIR95841.1 hypothetical protein I304_00597 [Cryptococcus deuterogattii CBS 10090]KIS02337.1 hypothetical protein L804_00598 [Cryptococcus deuterogattii 2001/935-1]KIY58784.1 hypothetical protein 